MTGGNAYYYDFDLLGSTAGSTGASGGYANSYSYLPFGGMSSLSGVVPNPFQFIGQYGVRTTGEGVYDMHTRTYLASRGGFISPDSLGIYGWRSESPEVRREQSGHRDYN